MSAKPPTLIRTISELRQALRPYRQRGSRIGFVPTMGALHEGHLSLIRRARQECDVVVVSIYVNPTQFGPAEDFDRYPRQLEKDLQACEQEGVDFVFAPSDREMYGDGTLTTVHVARLTDRLCGPFRPGHFDGVCTVVAKLFNIVQPDAAYFGQKDAQQAVVIRRMTADLNFPVEIVVCPTVRESDGLAASSRNAYLTEQQRRQATCIYRALKAAEEEILAGQREPAVLIDKIRQVILDAGPCEIDYIEIVDPETLEPVRKVSGRVLIATAVRIGNTRLIDNIVVEAPQAAEGG